MPEPIWPDDVRSTIGRRVELLADDTRRILAAASVLGRRFDLATLAATTRLDSEIVAGALAEAVAAEVITPEGDDRFAFAHALVEDTLYDSLTSARRSRIHGAAAAALEQLDPDDPPLAAIAYHRCAALPAGDRDLAVDYAQRAGADAAARGAHEQAVQHYERALDAARCADRGGCTLDAASEIALLCDLASACEHAGQQSRAESAYAEAIDTAQRAGDVVGVATAALGLAGGVDESVGFNLTGLDRVLLAMLDDARMRLPDSQLPLRSLVTTKVAGARYDAGEIDVAQQLSVDALALAYESNDQGAIAAALAMRHTALSAPEHLRERQALDDEFRTLDPALSVQAQVWRVGDLLECGDLATADAEMLTMKHGPLMRAHPRARWYVSLYRTMRLSLAGDLDAATELCEETRAIGERVGVRTTGVAYAVQNVFLARERRTLHGLPELLESLAEEHPLQAGFSVTAAWVRAEMGEFDIARDSLDRIARSGFTCIPRNGVWLANMRLLAGTVFEVGARDHVEPLYEMLLPFRDRWVVTSRVVAVWGSVEHSLGLLAFAGGDFERAHMHFDAADAVHDRLDIPIVAARTDLTRIPLLLAEGDEVGAERLRREIHETATARDWTDLAVRSAR